MKKRIITALLALCLLIPTGCGQSKSESSSAAESDNSLSSSSASGDDSSLAAEDSTDRSSTFSQNTGSKVENNMSSSNNSSRPAEASGNKTSSTAQAVSSAVPGNTPATQAKVHFINVNAVPYGSSSPTMDIGDCILIQVGGKNILIDGGEDRAVFTDNAIRYLKNSGVKKLDYVFLSHAHSDHAGGLYKIIDNFDLGMAATRKPDFSLLAAVETGWRTEYYYNRFEEAVGKKKDASGKALTVRQITKEATKITLSSDSYIVIFGSTLVDNQTKDEDYNYLSLSFLFVHQNVRMYLGGDTGDKADSILLGKLGQCDVIKPAHHGSGGPYTSQALLNETKPKIAVFTSFIKQATDYNQYFYPTVQKLANMGTKCYSVGGNDTIVITSNGKSVVCSATNQLKP